MSRMIFGAPTLAFTVERTIAEDAVGWAAYAVDPSGGVGPRASPVFERLGAAVAWALTEGALADPASEAA